MKTLFDNLKDNTTEAWVLILGLLASLYFATKTAIVLWNVSGAPLIGAIAVWVVIMVVGFLLSSILLIIVNKLLR